MSTRTEPPRVALVGNPNTGKSTLFNAITGGRARVGNYAGTTVDVAVGHAALDGVGEVEWIDVPGAYSLAARSPEERIALDTVLGRFHAAETRQRPVDALVVVLDAPRLQRSLYLLLQLLELRIPVIAALNLVDEARAEGKSFDVEALSRTLGVPVVATIARTGEGLPALRAAVAHVLRAPGTATPGAPNAWSKAVEQDTEEVVVALPPAWRSGDSGRDRAIARWWLSSCGDEDAEPGAESAVRAVREVRARAAAAGRDLDIEIVGGRYLWIDEHHSQFVREPDAVVSQSDRIDRVLLHPLWGTLAFFTVMFVVFQALFSWSEPAVGAIEAVVGGVGDAVRAAVDSVGAASSWPVAVVGDLLVDGIIGGVGSVLVFIPQIALLFAFLALLEDSGYLARAAHLMDRLLRLAGLPGRAFVPLLSGFACAVPAILATRTMARRRDRFLTMAVIPLTSCSARLPVYTLLIGALFPATLPGTSWEARPIALFGMYLFSTAVTLVAAMVIGRTVMAERALPDVIELPPYRWPQPRTVARAVGSRVGAFLREASGVILIATVVLWGLLSFPRVEAPASAGEVSEQVSLEHSFAGRIGKAIEPAIAPLGFDWQIGVGLIGAFAAREVFVSTMGVVYGVGSEADETSVDLRERLRAQRKSDGSARYTPLVGASLMVFFALAFQCLSTLAVLRREAGGWRWSVFVVAYMSVLAWGSAFVVYQGGRLFGFE